MTEVVGKINPDEVDDKITVEEYLRKKCDEEIKRLQDHADELVEQFRSESSQVRENLAQKLVQ